MLKELRTQHRSIIQMSFSGFKNNEIAEKLEMTQSTVSQILRSPLGQAYLNGLQDKAQEDTLDVRKKLVSLNKGALDTFTRILDPTQKAPFNVQFNTAKDILDRNGHKAPDKLNIDMTMVTKTDQEIDAEIIALENSITRSKVIEHVADNKDFTNDETPKLEKPATEPSSDQDIPINLPIHSIKESSANITDPAITDDHSVIDTSEVDKNLAMITSIPADIFQGTSN